MTNDGDEPPTAVDSALPDIHADALTVPYEVARTVVDQPLPEPSGNEDHIRTEKQAVALPVGESWSAEVPVRMLGWPQRALARLLDKTAPRLQRRRDRDPSPPVAHEVRATPSLEPPVARTSERSSLEQWRSSVDALLRQLQVRERRSGANPSAIDPKVALGFVTIGLFVGLSLATITMLAVLVGFLLVT